MNYNSKIAEFWATEAAAGRIYWHDELSEELGFFIAGHLDRCERDKNIEAVTLDINTNGGCGSAMWHIVDRLRSMTTPVTTVCSGKALSAGFLVLAAGKTRKCFAHSTLLFHGAWHWEGREKSPQLMDDAEYAQSFDEAMCDFLGKSTKKRSPHWRRIVASMKDRYVTPAEALEWGVIDEISKEGAAT